jgi:hypothetical protein
MNQPSFSVYSVVRSLSLLAVLRSICLDEQRKKSINDAHISIIEQIIEKELAGIGQNIAFRKERETGQCSVKNREREREMYISEHVAHIGQRSDASTYVYKRAFARFYVFSFSFFFDNDTRSGEKTYKTMHV